MMVCVTSSSASDTSKGAVHSCTCDLLSISSTPPHPRNCLIPIHQHHHSTRIGPAPPCLQPPYLAPHPGPPRSTLPQKPMEPPRLAHVCRFRRRGGCSSRIAPQYTRKTDGPRAAPRSSSAAGCGIYDSKANRVASSNGVLTMGRGCRARARPRKCFANATRAQSGDCTTQAQASRSRGCGVCARDGRGEGATPLASLSSRRARRTEPRRAPWQVCTTAAEGQRDTRQTRAFFPPRTHGTPAPLPSLARTQPRARRAESRVVVVSEHKPNSSAAAPSAA